MRRRAVLFLWIVLGVLAVASFCTGRITGTRGDLAPGGQQFQAELQRLTDQLRLEQGALSSRLADEAASDKAILAQVELVVAAHEELMRATGRHIVALRSSLGNAGRHGLMQSCASSLRGQIRRRYRNRGAGIGGGFGPGGGMGRGGGHLRRGQYGQCCLARRLALSDEQVAVAMEKDPGFEEEGAALKGKVNEAQAALVEAFEDSESDDAVLLRAIEAVIEAHSALERRVARHVLLLRPRLSAEQMEFLIGLCTGRGCGVNGAAGVQSRTWGSVFASSLRACERTLSF